MKITRLHRIEYNYRVTDSLKLTVAKYFGVTTLVESKCSNFEDLKESTWVTLSRLTIPECDTEYGINTLKEAARQVVEDYTGAKYEAEF